MLYELRVYEMPQGKMRAMHDLLGNHTMAIWKRLGIRPIAFWENVIGPMDTLTYILAWESLAEREQKWDVFLRDPEWLKSITEAVKNGPILLKGTNTIMQPTSYSPMQ